MLWGYFLKIVLADRIAVFVDTVYENYIDFKGYYLIVATFLFAIQIYCDFSGYSTIAQGAAKILGIELMENFNSPYLSTSVASFWQNWHISLTSWFRDYLYIPLGGNRLGLRRKQINKMIVFLASGLWHGANFSYIVWGGLNGLYQLIGEWLYPIRTKCLKIFRLNTNSLGHKIAQCSITFLLVDFAWLFFRAPSLNDSIKIISSIFSVNNPWIIIDGSLYTCGLDRSNFWLMIFCIAILLFSDICKHQGICIRNIIIQQDYWFRIIFIAVSTTAILLFGIWGPEYDSTNFIYFQF